MSLLFHDIIYGPVKSRRFGHSLGLNLLPSNSKICSFNCIYCECGWNPEHPKDFFVNTKDFMEALDHELRSIKESNTPLDVLTYAGNGEPTLHPDFLEIVRETIRIKNNYFPNKKIVLLSNGSTLTNEKIQKAIDIIDMPVLKLDSAIESTMRAINLPSLNFSFNKFLHLLHQFKNRVYIQTMFLQGNYHGKSIDNTTEQEINALIEQYQIIQPKSVMLYSLDRIPPLSSLKKISTEKMTEIAEKIKKSGINTTWV